MFKRSRRRIVAAIMTALVCLFLGTLAVIYASSYIEVSRENFEMLSRHAQMYSLPAPDGSIPSDVLSETRPARDNDPMPGGKRGDNHSFRVATFYSVAVGADGTVLHTDTGERGVYDSETLAQYAADILSGGKTRGRMSQLLYLVTHKNGYTLVAFMDNTVMQHSMTTLFRYTLLFGSVALFGMLFLSMFLARRIVAPLETVYLKQRQFICDAGHELKTPVAVINANAELLHRQIGDDPWLLNIQYENERMGQLVGQLLELSRTENVKSQHAPLELSRLVGGGVLPFESVAYENGLALCVDIAPDITLTGNARQLEQLVSILLDNAIRHGRGGQQVDVRLTRTRTAAILSVINAGEPIPPEQIAQLFERFYRIDEARTGKDGHYGLGLAIAKAIVEAHRGKIEVHCADGRIEFRTTLPLS